MKKLFVAAVLALVCASSAQAANRLITFPDGLKTMFRGEAITKDNFNGEVTLRDIDSGKAVLTVGDQSITMNKVGDNSYVDIGRPEGENLITTIEILHFSQDGTVNYTKTVNGVAPMHNYNKGGDDIDLNHVTMAIGKWSNK